MWLNNEEHATFDNSSALPCRRRLGGHANERCYAGIILIEAGHSRMTTNLANVTSSGVAGLVRALLTAALNKHWRLTDTRHKSSTVILKCRDALQEYTYLCIVAVYLVPGDRPSSTCQGDAVAGTSVPGPPIACHNHQGASLSLHD